MCALADAYGPCAAYRGILVERGYDIVHVQTYGDVSPYLAANHDSGLYLADIVHSGDPAVTAERIRRSWQVEFLVPGLETGFHTASSIAAALGLPHNAGFHEPWSKGATYEALRAAGVPAAKYLSVASIDDIDAALEWVSSTCGYPVVSKPPESAGADDVHVCSNAEHLARAIRGTLGRKNTLGLPNRSVVLQEFLRGEEYIVDTVSRGGEHYVCLLLRCHKRLVGDGRMIYDRCELIPCEGEVADVLSTYIKQVLDALKYHEGPAHSEVMLTERGPRLIETNPRLDGGLSPEAEAACIGYGQRELTIDAFSAPDLWRAKSAQPYRILQQMTLVCGISERSGTLLEIPMAGWLP
ncbi:MAG: ATP-grasp domain-containing protein, partial [Byssovorax sp.]